MSSFDLKLYYVFMILAYFSNYVFENAAGFYIDRCMYVCGRGT